MTLYRTSAAPLVHLYFARATINLPFLDLVKPAPWVATLVVYPLMHRRSLKSRMILGPIFDLLEMILNLLRSALTITAALLAVADKTIAQICHPSPGCHAPQISHQKVIFTEKLWISESRGNSLILEMHCGDSIAIARVVYE